MKDPVLTAAFDDDATILQLRRHDDEVLNEVNWPLGKLDDLGYDGACLLMGNAVLRLLERAHGEVYRRHPRILPPPPAPTNASIVISELIERSRRSKTCRYVSAIDALLALHADEIGHTSLPTQWPSLRNELMDFDD